MKNKRIADNGPDVEEIFNTWIAGYDQADLEQVMSVFDPAAVYIAPCYPAKGFASLRNWFAFDFERSGARPHWAFKIESVDASGDLAVVISLWAGFTDFGKRQQAEVHRFRSVDVFRLGANGWKILRTVNGPDECCPAPTRKKKGARKKK